MVTQAAAAAATGRLAQDVWTVDDGVLGAWFLPTFLAASGLASAHYVVLLPSVERCLDRVAMRVGHGFADAPAARHMHDQFASAAIEERHVLRDPPDDVESVVDMILRRVDDGVLRDGT